jgi:hypothetical protein|tara:strand:+ start:29667 stop:29984 length:318 start_codon:yes stop_codon:yes gene_type:complete
MPHNLKDMIGGWFIGDFDPSVWKTSAFEVAVKEYKAGDKEPKHLHKIAVEFTVIVRGKVLMNGVEHGEGDIIRIDTGKATDFEALEDTITVVVKRPSVAGDKYIL